MPEGKSTDRAAAQIRALIEDRVTAIHAKDIHGLMANYAPDVVTFDALDPLQYIGSAAPRKRGEAWFAGYHSPIGYAIRDVHVTAGSDVAFCHYLYRVSGTLKDGGDVNMWVRATIGYHKIDGTWLVVHEHNSVPFDPESGKASVSLTP